MHKTLVRFFIKSVGILLLLIAIAKFISGAGSANILQSMDPLLGISYKKLFFVVGVIELGVASICIISNQIKLQAGLIAWLGTNFIVYRFCLLWTKVNDSCPCLGNLTDALRISPHTTDTAMKIILAYLLIGSYGILFWLWLRCKKSRLYVSVQ